MVEKEEEEDEHAFVCWLQAQLVKNDGVMDTNLREEDCLTKSLCLQALLKILTTCSI